MDRDTLRQNYEYRDITTNPFHDYTNLDEIRDRVIHQKGLLTLGLYETSEIVPKGRWSPYYHNLYHSIQVSKTKKDMESGNSVYIPVEYETGELREWIKREPVKKSKTGKVRMRRKDNPTLEGDFWVYRGYRSVYKRFSNDIQQFLEICREYRQIPSGLSHNQRHIVVCDFDDTTYTENTYDDLMRICKENGIPPFTYLEVHLEEKEKKEDEFHFQVGWILDKPFSYFGVPWEDDREYLDQKELFIRVLRTLCKIFNSDPHFNGYQIHNPNWKEHTYTIWNNDVVSKNELVNSVIPIYREMREKEIEEILTEEDINSTETEDERQTREIGELSLTDFGYLSRRELTSRHCFLVKTLRDYLFRYRRNNSCFPTFDHCMKVSKELERMSLKFNHKTDIEDENQIKTTVKSVLDWCKKEYKVSDYESGEMGNMIIRMNKEIRVIRTHLMVSEGMKPKDICKELGVCRKSVKNYLREEPSKEGIIELLNRVNTFSETKGWSSRKMREYVRTCEKGLKLYHGLTGEQIEEPIENVV